MLFKNEWIVIVDVWVFIRLGSLCLEKYFDKLLEGNG